MPESKDHLGGPLCGLQLLPCIRCLRNAGFFKYLIDHVNLVRHIVPSQGVFHIPTNAFVVAVLRQLLQRIIPQQEQILHGDSRLRVHPVADAVQNTAVNMHAAIIRK